VYEGPGELKLVEALEVEQSDELELIEEDGCSYKL
jgi:hypothetical protein